MYEEEKKLLKELNILRQEHHDLDEVLTTSVGGNNDQLTVQRLKKRKLWLKDRINLLESCIYPDIIA
jgi:hypothetical protein